LGHEFILAPKIWTAPFVSLSSEVVTTICAADVKPQGQRHGYLSWVKCQIRQWLRQAICGCEVNGIHRSDWLRATKFGGAV
jgi:hypothetical protein